MKRLLAVAIFLGSVVGLGGLAGVCGACGGCGSRPPPAASSGSAAGSGASRGPCEGMRERVEQLYRAEAPAKQPSRVDEAVADNTAMVMTDCAQAPAKVAACLAAASTVAELEARCLTPIDDEGTEGDRLTR